MLIIFAFMWVCAARASDGNMLEARVVELESARQAGEERARQATADLRRELEEVKLARQADADLRKEVEEIKQARQADSDLRRELEKVKLARQADADLRKEVEELKLARQADADLRKEVEEIKRLRRGDADLIAELKKLIQSEIGEMSFCEMGTHQTTKGSTVTQGAGGNGFDETVNIPFGRTFKRIPKVSVSISQFHRNQQSSGDRGWSLTVQASSLTTESFNLYLKGGDTHIPSLTAAWIACV